MARLAVPPRRIVVRAELETIVLAAAAVAVTVGLASTIHARPPQPSSEQVQSEDWAGHLAKVSDDGAAATAGPISSASLVLAKNELTLPASPVRALARVHGCDSGSCLSPTPVPRPPSRASGTSGERQEAKAEAARHDTNLMSRLNPLDRLPDAVKRPFSYAGTTIAGWFGRL